jgi:hypothetical protein
MPDTPTSTEPPTSPSLEKDTDDYISTPHNSEESDWVPPVDANNPSLAQPAPSGSASYSNLSEHIAYVRFCALISSFRRPLANYNAQKYLIPILPQSIPPTPTFTIGQLRLTTQRLYLATLPAYVPFLRNLKRLATWKDPQSSLVYCCVRSSDKDNM